MGQGYVRNDTINNIADGNIINASDFDGEYDAIEAAFNSSTYCGLILSSNSLSELQSLFRPFSLFKRRLMQFVLHPNRV